MPDTNVKSNILTKKDIVNFGNLVDDFDDAIIGINLNGVIESYNKGAEVLYGYNKNELIGKTAAILIPEESENEFYDILSKINKGEKVQHWETFRKKKNGELILVSISITRLHDDNGQLIGAVCIGRSLEERQKLIDKLKENEEKWRFAIEGGNFGVWDWNIPANTIYYSDRWKEMLGYESSEISDSFDEWKIRIHKDDIAYFWDKLEGHFNGKEFVIEYRLKCKDGNYKWVKSRGKVVKSDKGGRPERMIGTSEDINEEIILRKKIEERNNRIKGFYNLAIAGLAHGEIILDASDNPIDFKCLHMNIFMEKILGCKFEDLNKKNNIKLLPKNKKKLFYMFAQASLYGKAFKFEYYDKTNDKYYDVNIYSPNHMQFVLLVNDITENKKKGIILNEKYEELQSLHEELIATEEELRQNYKELEKASMVKDQFLANMSHELRTPLNGILGCAQLLRLSKLDNEQNEDVLMIEKSSNHLLSLLNDILDLSKIEAGKVELKCIRFNFFDQMDYIIKSLIMLAKDKDIQIMYYIDPFINKELIGDNLRLKQVLNNLISNAVKFTEHGHIFLKVEMLEKTPEKTKLQFSVEDTGRGISENFKKDIFSKFTQENSTYTKNYNGTGLGLAISKNLVEMMGGDIGFESEIGKGSRFYFTAVFKNITYRNSAIDNKDNSQCQPGKVKAKKVLVVEDNEINMKITSAFLKQINYEYVCVRNGQEALDYLKKNSADIILMDIQMPVLNGYDATKIIREKEKKEGGHKIIIAMTAYVMSGDREKFIDCGMDEYISKPFNIEKLSEMLDKY